MVADNDFITILGPPAAESRRCCGSGWPRSRRTSGHVLLDGAPVTGPGRDRGMVFQSTRCSRGSRLLRTSPSACESAACQRPALEDRGNLCERGAQGVRADYPKQLSGGMQQRTGHRTRARERPQDHAARRAVRGARQSDAGLDAGDAPGDLGARAQDGDVRHARYRRSRSFSPRASW